MTTYRQFTQILTWKICWTKLTRVISVVDDQGCFIGIITRKESSNTATRTEEIYKSFRFIKELPHCNFSIANAAVLYILM